MTVYKIETPTFDEWFEQCHGASFDEWFEQCHGASFDELNLRPNMRTDVAMLALARSVRDYVSQIGVPVATPVAVQSSESTSVPLLRDGTKFIASIPAGASICAFGNRLIVAHPDMPLQEITTDGLKPI